MGTDVVATAPRAEAAVRPDEASPAARTDIGVREDPYDAVDDAIAASFPASDPPPWTLGGWDQESRYTSAP